MIFVCGFKRMPRMYIVHVKIKLQGLTTPSDDDLVSLGKHASELEMKKASIGWNLEQLEAAADLNGAEERSSDSDDE